MKQASRRKFHYIYKITRLDESGKYYIGMHSTDEVDDGYFGSGSYLSRSLKKHGKDKHSKEILEFLPSREALKLREKELVNEELLLDKRCMNLRLGGEGGFSKAESLKGTINSNRSPQRDKIAAAIKTNETKKALGIYGWRGHRFQFNGMLGKIHSTETRAKMIDSHSGEKNSQFGSCWVTNGIRPIKIRKEKLDEYLMNGYSRGRNLKN